MIPELEHLTNFRHVSPNLTTSGQPDASDVERIAGAGYHTLINLALDTSDRALPDERAVAEAHGLEYLHFPLHWEQPDVQLARGFVAALHQRRERRVHVHCVMNYRVSALVHAHRVAVLGDEPGRARRDLFSVWTPNETWRRLATAVARTALGPVRLETERLTLREVAIDDAEAMQRFAGDRDVVRFMQWGPNTLEQTRTFCEKQLLAQRDLDRRDFEFSICEKDGEALIGAAGLRVESEQRAAELGYVLHHEFWGRGLATEAARALSQFGFGVLGLHRISALVDPENLGSRRVLGKLGMREEGTLRHQVHVRGEFRDRIVAATLEDDHWARVPEPQRP